jgi:hypothetical protein
VLTEAEALEYFVEVLGLDHRYSEHRAGRSDIQVTVRTDTADEDLESAAALDGVKEMLSATFRQTKNLGDMGDAATVRDILFAVTQFFEDCPNARGILAYNFETILVQRLGDDGIVLDQQLLDANGDNRHGTLDDLIAKYPVRQVRQIFR